MRRSSWIALLLWFISLLLALNTGRELLYNLLYMMSILLVVSWLWTWLNVRSIRLTRLTRAQRSQVGKIIEEHFELYNLSRLPKTWLEVQDHSTLPGHYPSRVVSALGARKRHLWMRRTPCYLRGEYRLGPMTFRSGDPLGIFEMTRFIPQSRSIIVYPATLPIPGFQLPPAQMAGGEATRRRTHYLSSHVSTVRDYAPGDSFNRIHWRSTARTGRLISKEFELDPTSDVWIVLDLDANYHRAQPWQLPDEYEQPAALWRTVDTGLNLIPASIEYAVTAAASVAQRYLREKRAVGLLTHTLHRTVIPPDRGQRQLEKILELLAVVQPLPTLPLDRMLFVESPFLDRRSTLIVITPSTDASWIGALLDLAQGGIQSTVIHIDAATFGPAPASQRIINDLWASNIPVYRLFRGADVSSALSTYARPS